MNLVFIDHDIENYHANIFARLLAERADFRLAGVYATRKDNLAGWAEKHGVPAMDSIGELGSVADAVMVLAPSNPETHWDLCRQAFTLGKPVYVDKTFATSPTDGLRIFAEADRLSIPIQSSSVLRYTEVQEHCKTHAEPPRLINTWAPGRDFVEYLIHPVEHVVSVLGFEYREIVCREVAGFRQIEITFADGGVAVIHLCVNHRVRYFSVVSHADETTPVSISGGEGLFRAGLNGILDFFQNPGIAIDRRETLAILEILERIKTAYAV